MKVAGGRDEVLAVPLARLRPSLAAASSEVPAAPEIATMLRLAVSPKPRRAPSTPHVRFDETIHAHAKFPT